MTLQPCFSINRALFSWGVLLALMEQLEQHSPGSLKHGRQVGRYTQRLARHIGWSKEAAFCAYIAGVLHDIGKLEVPAEILNQAGPILNPAEWAVIHAHTVAGRKIVARFSELHPILDGPYLHHERWDGLGYPLGLRDRHIPMLARMIAVTDVYSAMTLPRTYREAMRKDTVLKHLWFEAGTSLDPTLVLAFTCVLGERIPVENKG